MTANNTQTGPKFTHYRSKHDGQVHTALRTPAGYEDQHPEEYEGVDGYDPAKGDAVADQRRLQDETDSRVDRSGYMAPVIANTPIGTNEEPLPATSLIYANPGSPATASAPLPGKSDGGQVVVGGADRSQVRVSGEPPAPVEGVVDPSEVAQKQIDANAAAAKEVANPTPPTSAPTAPAPTGDNDDTPPSDGLTVAQLREELDAKGIAYTSSDLKPALQEKLDNAPKD